MVGIEMLSGTIGEDMLVRLAGQNKKQREGLSLLCDDAGRSEALT